MQALFSCSAHLCLLSPTGVRQDAIVAMHAGEQPYAEQKPWKLFDVSESNVAPLVLLATLNGTLLAVLAQYISDPVAMQLLRQSAGPGFTSLVAAVAPALCVYASLYVLGPAFRYLQNLMRNSQIERANAQRSRAAQVRVAPLAVHTCPLPCRCIVSNVSGMQSWVCLDSCGSSAVLTARFDEVVPAVLVALTA